MPQTQAQTATRAAVRAAWPVERFDTPGHCVGYRVRDLLGRKIRRLKRLFLNENGGAEYAEIGVGPFGMKTVMIPVQAVTAHAEGRYIVLH